MAWYVVQTKPREEGRVSAGLRDKSLEVYFPKISVRRRRRGSVFAQLEPLFPGYLFVSVDLTPSTWNTVRWMPGVRALLGCDGIPSPVPEESIAFIRRHAGPGDAVQLPLVWQPGVRVRIKDGPCAGLAGILERPTSRAGRVRVLLEMLHGAAVELEDLDLELVS